MIAGGSVLNPGNLAAIETGKAPRSERHMVRGSLAAVVVLAAAGLAGAEPRPSLTRPDARRLATAPAKLRARMREDPFVYFRFLNSAWAATVCEAFYAELPALPTAILHGDAHLEQYALTASARGLDDFDDAAHGPAAIDLVRFLGSIDLVARRRGWIGDRNRLFDQFFDGYTRALYQSGIMEPRRRA